MPRYFVAIEPPEPTLSAVRDFMTESGDPAPVPHVTLVPPGGLTPDEHWLAAVQDVVHRSPTFSVELTSPGAFGARVLVLLVRSPGIRVLRRDLLRAVPATQAGLLASEPEEYVPHLTLARFGVNDRGRLENARVGAERLARFPPFDVTEVIVFRRESSEPYLAWRRIPLGPRGDASRPGPGRP